MIRHPSRPGALITLLLGATLSLMLMVWLGMNAPWDRFNTEGQWLMSHVWGQITLLDLYSGFLLALTLVWLFEPRLSVRIGLSVALPLLGNPIFAIWLILRWKHLKSLAGQRSFD